MTTHMAPMAEEVYVRQPYEQSGAVAQPLASNTVVLHEDVGYDRAALEAAELTAFEKGRMQGEMEAIRRAEAQAPLKVMAPVGVVVNQPVLLDQPDVLEINRLTWLQKIAAVLGELSLLGVVAITIGWLDNYRNGFGWTNSRDNGDHTMFNAGLVAFALGLFFNGQAISNYRFFPLNLNAHINRGWYLFMQLLTGACYSVAMAAVVMTYPTGEDTFWRVDAWIFAFALFVWATHWVYSTVRTILEHVWPVDYEVWAEVNNNLDNTHNRRWFGSRAMSLNGKAGPAAGEIDRRTIYTAAPVTLGRGRNVPAASANVGAQVPVAPANAPRWAENPRTHAEDYFLLARAKWANIAYWSMGAAFLMLIASTEVLFAAGRGTWSAGTGDDAGSGRLVFSSREAHLIGGLGLVTLASLIFISYAAMPPRTTLVKNGILSDAARRPSISHNAETIV